MGMGCPESWITEDTTGDAEGDSAIDTATSGDTGNAADPELGTAADPETATSTIPATTATDAAEDGSSLSTTDESPATGDGNSDTNAGDEEVPIEGEASG